LPSVNLWINYRRPEGECKQASAARLKTHEQVDNEQQASTNHGHTSGNDFVESGDDWARHVDLQIHFSGLKRSRAPKPFFPEDKHLNVEPR
jgi:hypothetical protein